ncbi:hypothetical protein CIG75_02190 [Tumebacillus algifaecis]|uniref:DUF5666 domain-containing protein n=1 Tax=Tumebacillus algifaecis TaxID=1214604 RepID=A0A223CX19_9BACL|nr:hypothetical protein [Tumebacillus algifaecis]ASS73900.1 hypothetical protein CIG75_02190 [Tumebacillus algifaecis]
MKRRIAFFGTMALTLAVGVMIGQIGKADSGSTPGSAEDPIVTKSYVDSKIASLGSGGGNPGGGTPGGNPGGSTTPISGVDTFKVIQLKTGQTLKGGEGTEIIVRSGSVTAIASSSGGLSDVSNSADLAEGAQVPANHLILVPRADGRGIKAVANDPYIMVRGTYTIQ